MLMDQKGNPEDLQVVVHAGQPDSSSCSRWCTPWWPGRKRVYREVYRAAQKELEDIEDKGQGRV